MQITPIQVPVVPVAAMPQETAAKIPVQIQIQAAQPIIQRAVDPAATTDRGKSSRGNKERSDGGDSPANKRGGKVNIRA